jgi:hypothetical protein
MTEHPDRLAEELRELGRTLPAPLPADLAGRVMAGIAGLPPHRRRWRRRIAGLLALLLAAVATVALATPVRAAVGRVLGFGGVRVHEQAGPSPRPGATLPGEHATDLAGAARVVGFPVRVPSALGAPDRVTVADGRVVSLYWSRPGGPVRLDEFAGDLGPYWEKYTALGAARAVTLNGHEALWFAEPVTLVYVAADGTELTDTARETTATLLWRDSPVTLRLDGVRALDEALAVAATAR